MNSKLTLFEKDYIKYTRKKLNDVLNDIKNNKINRLDYIKEQYKNIIKIKNNIKKYNFSNNNYHEKMLDYIIEFYSLRDILLTLDKENQINISVGTFFMSKPEREIFYKLYELKKRKFNDMLIIPEKKLIIKNTNNLWCDFFISLNPKEKNKNLCIEYDGLQHYDTKNFFYSNKIAISDTIKNIYFIDNNVSLIRINYYCLKQFIKELPDILEDINNYKQLFYHFEHKYFIKKEIPKNKYFNESKIKNKHLYTNKKISHFTKNFYQLHNFITTKYKFNIVDYKIDTKQNYNNSHNISEDDYQDIINYINNKSNYINDNDSISSDDSI
jgi:hypothetical protein